MIFPPFQKVSTRKEKGRFQKFTGAVSEAMRSGLMSIFGSGNKESSNTESGRELPSMEETRQICLGIYLAQSYDILRSGVIPNPVALVDEMTHIRKCLYGPLLQDGKKTKYQHPYIKEWKYFNLIHVRSICYDLFMIFCFC